MIYSIVGAALAAAAYAQTSYPEQTSAPLPFPGSTYPQFSNIADIQDGAASPPKYPSPWMAPVSGSNWTDAYQRARAFVSQLTLAEKVNLTTGIGWEGDRCVGNTGGVPRLGFRAMCMQDSPLGVRDTDFNSAFPAGVNVAATWSRGLAYARGQAMGSEHRDKGVDVQLGPVAGPLGRAPEGGRNWEGFSPDPYLTGKLMADTVNGIQDAGVIACSKHYIANEQEHFRQSPQSGYNITDAISHNLDDSTMHELYLWPFADAVRAGTGSIMCSYNQVNNSYACQNSYTLNYLLKGELGFQGFVMSDWSGQHSGVGSALAGMDMSMPGDIEFDTGTSFWGANLTIAVLNGTVPQWRVDDMATRIVAAWYYVGRDKTQVPVNFDSWTTDTYGNFQYYAGENYGLINQHVDVRGEGQHGALIREIGAKSIVLLKNQQTLKTGGNALPLTGNEQLTAIIGEDAAPSTYGPNGCSDRGCNNGTLAMGWGSGTANFPYLVSPLEAIQAHQVANYQAVEFVSDNAAASQIETLAGRASVSLVFVNADSGEGYIGVDGNQGDRNNLTLWKNGDSLINRTASYCNNTVVVVHSVGPVILDQWQQHPNVTAILWAGLPGEQSGNGLVDVLYGAVNPGGKLPFSIAANRTQYSTDLLYYPNEPVPQQSFTEGIFIDYRAFDRANTTPTYEFGYGLSYTTFDYSNIAIQTHNVSAYRPASGMIPAAPSSGNSSNVTSSHVYPSGFRKIMAYIYPYLNSTDLRASSGDPNYGAAGFVPDGAQDGSPQPIPAAGGAPGGNPLLYDVAFTVTATITNTGKVVGEEVPQLYVSLGGPNNAVKVLRGFERLSIQPGQSTTFTADLTRRDLSNWDTVSQNWVVNNYTKTVYVGSSSKKLPLQATLPRFS